MTLELFNIVGIVFMIAFLMLCSYSIGYIQGNIASKAKSNSQEIIQ